MFKKPLINDKCKRMDRRFKLELHVRTHVKDWIFSYNK